jgi:hypothetical protein
MPITNLLAITPAEPPNVDSGVRPVKIAEAKLVHIITWKGPKSSDKIPPAIHVVRYPQK